MRRLSCVSYTLLLAAVHGLAFAQVSETRGSGDYPSPERFEGAIEAFEAKDREEPPPVGAILCLGSSSIRLWHETIAQDLAPLTVVPRGFGGSNMNDALHYADRIVIPYRPRAIVLYEGDNDIAQGISPTMIRDTFRAFVEKVHEPLPETRIYFLSIKPSISRWNMWGQMKEANRLIAEACSEDERLTYVNLASEMIDPEGMVRKDLFLEDDLHLNSKGYAIWKQVLRPILMETEWQFEKGGIISGPEEARRSFARLLKIPLENPGVSVSVRSVTEKESLRIEDVSWPSLDAEEPMAFVVRPVDSDSSLPAIICLHGSSGSREAMTTLQFGRGEWTQYGRNSPHQRLLGWATELARDGYLILALTQRGLDRRTPDTNDQSKDLLVRGRTLMGAIVYEIRQAVTYLQSRPDVDPSRIGMTGMSFGGITTFYTWLVDDRVAAAAPICGGVGSVDVFLRIGSRGYHGFYWWIPDMLTVGDQGDFAAAMAPRPLFLWAPLNDIGMPKEGVDRFLEAAKPAYERLGKSENLEVRRPPGEHEFSLDAFQAMKAFFDRHLK